MEAIGKKSFKDTELTGYGKFHTYPCVFIHTHTHARTCVCVLDLSIKKVE